MLHRGILALALAAVLTVSAQAEYTFRPISSGSGIGTVNGIVKGDGAGNPSQAVAGTDYVVPSALSAYLTSATAAATYQAQTANLTALLAMGTGCAAHSGASAWTGRTITGTAGEITVTNGNCLAGDPTISLPATIITTGKTFSGTFTQSGGYAYLGDFNTGAGGFPTASKALAIDINSTNGPLDVGFHNTYTAATESFTFSQLTGASSSVYLASFFANGNFGFGTRTPEVASAVGFNANYFTHSSDHFGVNTTAVIAAGGNITNTSFPAGAYSFYNSSLGTPEKRLADIVGFTDGATNSGRIALRTFNAGSQSEWLSIDHLGAIRFANYTCAGGGGLLKVDGSGNVSCSNSITGATINSSTIGVTTPAAGKFTTLEATGAATIVAGTINGTTVGASTPATGKFTTIESANALGANTRGVVTLSNSSTGVVGTIQGTSGGGGGLAQIDFATDGAANSGMIDLYTANAGSTTSRVHIDKSGNVGVGTTSPAAQLHTTGTVRFAGIPSVATPGCLANDASGNVSGGNACSGGGMPAGGSIGQAPLNSAAGTALWRTEPFTNISALTGADCTGAVATVISTVIGSIKSIALPTDCTLKITGNDTIAAGVFFAIPCGARVQVDGAAILTFNAETDDNTCQKFSASGAGAGAGGGIVKGLRFNRPEWWGAAGDCNYAGACTHDDAGPVQQAFNSAQASNAASGGQRSQIKFGCGKGYGVSTGIAATPSRNAPLEISGCAPIVGGNSEGGSALIGRAGFTGSILTVATTGGGNVQTNWLVHDLNIRSYTNGQADTCLQIGAAGQTLGNKAGRNRVSNMLIENCKHSISFAGKIDQVTVDGTFMVAATSLAGASCIEATIGSTDYLADTTFQTISCDQNVTPHATASCMTFHATGTAQNIVGIRITDFQCYAAPHGIIIQADSTSTIADFWAYGIQIDGMPATSRGIELLTNGSGQIANVVIDKPYFTSLFNVDTPIAVLGTGGGTIAKSGFYGVYINVSSGGRAVAVDVARSISITGARISGGFAAQAMLLNNCAGCIANDNIMDVPATPTGILLGGNTDYSQACNNTAIGNLAPAAVSASSATGTHNIYFGSGYQTCPNN